MSGPRLQFTLPTCARCGRDVDEMSMYSDELRHEEVFQVRCHGETEETRLTHSDLVNAASIGKGIAFQPAKGVARR